ncbi:MAG: choice-of-anchor R domain-containing protein, partial [Thermoplasmata archaeon]
MSRRLPTSPLAGILVLVFLASSVLGFLSTPAAAFGERVYESNTTINGNTHFNVFSGQSVAQSFLATGTYRLLNLTLRLRNAGDTNDPINLSIRTDAANVPSDTVLAATQLVLGNNVLANYAVTLPSPPGMTVGQRYWIVAS